MEVPHFSSKFVPGYIITFFEDIFMVAYAVNKRNINPNI